MRGSRRGTMHAILSAAAAFLMNPVGGIQARPPPFLSRRSFAEGGAGVSLGLLWKPRPSLARGLISFPPQRPLENRFFFVRAGESAADAAGVVRTNPVDKLAVDNGLTSEGLSQAERAADVLEGYGVTSPAIYYSTWAKSAETANVLANRFQVGFDRKLPEYTYLDCRGMGGFDGTPLASAAAAQAVIDARDVRESPPGTDEGALMGYGGESVAALLVRGYQVRQSVWGVHIGLLILSLSLALGHPSQPP